MDLARVSLSVVVAVPHPQTGREQLELRMCRAEAERFASSVTADADDADRDAHGGNYGDRQGKRQSGGLCGKGGLRAGRDARASAFKRMRNFTKLDKTVQLLLLFTLRNASRWRSGNDDMSYLSAA